MCVQSIKQNQSHIWFDRHYLVAKDTLWLSTLCLQRDKKHFRQHSYIPFDPEKAPVHGGLQLTKRERNICYNPLLEVTQLKFKN